jgi:pyruvate kinase
MPTRETLAKQGFASRAEITDAAMGKRAERVLFNKGPHIHQALRVLDDILQREQSHHSKKPFMLRPGGFSGKSGDFFRARDGSRA